MKRIKTASNNHLRFFNFKKVTMRYSSPDELSMNQILELDNLFNKVGNEFKAWHIDIILDFIQNNLDNFYERYTKLRTLTPHTEEYYKVRYGDEEGKLVYINHNEKAKQNLPSTITYWLKRGLSYDDAQSSVKNHQLKAGKIAGAATKGTKGTSCRSIHFWIKRGFSEKDAAIKVKEIQSTNTIEKYIEKYGVCVGVIKFNQRKANWKIDLKKTND